MNFNPQKGHEQAGRRPALAVSLNEYNRKVGMALFCPVTSQVKGYPFEVVLPEDFKLSGAVLSDQVKSLDWRARKVSLCCKVPNEILEEVLQKLSVILF